jgi:hypothetical protein
VTFDRSLWLSRRAIRLHAVIVVIVPSFTALCVWQVNRALDGNNLSWAYVFEWPFFAGYAVYMWWRFVHESPEAADPVTASSEGGPAPALVRAPAEAEDADAAAYNRYLADLDQRGGPKRWRDHSA